LIGLLLGKWSCPPVRGPVRRLPTHHESELASRFDLSIGNQEIIKRFSTHGNPICSVPVDPWMKRGILFLERGDQILALAGVIDGIEAF
jgi:hypothetical protein